MAVAFRTFAISEMVVATISKFEAEYDKIMDGEYPFELLYKSDAGVLAKACKEIGFEFIYVSLEVLKREIMGRKVVFDMADLYWEAAESFASGQKLKGFKSKIYSQISSNYRQIFEHNLLASDQLNIPADYFRMQLVTDQISGMTDSFAVLTSRIDKCLSHFQVAIDACFAVA